MQKLNYKDFAEDIEQNLKNRKPLSGQLELSYRCNLNCIHCYCKGSENQEDELSTQEWKDIIDEIHKEGFLWLTFTGGEPLLRDDFLDIYSYAHRKGFLINLFTNGLLLNEETIDFLQKNRPLLIEITLNGITESTYESIAKTKGALEKIMSIIQELVARKLPLVLKCNGLKQNKHEILKIKALTESLLGKGKFKFDSFISPRINGDKAPCNLRLRPEEILEIEGSDPDMVAQLKEEFHQPIDFKRPDEFLYQCNAWWTNFFINPYGRLQFCHLSQRYSCNLKTRSFKDGFYNEFPKLLNEKFTTDSKCKSCELRKYCYFCPARAFLETANQEGPVEYYCQLAKARFRQKQLLKA